MSRSRALSTDHRAVIDAILRTDFYAFVQAIFRTIPVSPRVVSQIAGGADVDISAGANAVSGSDGTRSEGGRYLY